MKNYKIKTTFVITEEPKAKVNETNINSIFFILIFVEIVLNTILYLIFQNGKITCSNPADIKRF